MTDTITARKAVPDSGQADHFQVSDTRALRSCLGQFATGVTVMTAYAQGETVGVTANSFSSLSLDPPLILWSIGRSSRSLPVFQAASHFAVNILAADQIFVSQMFSRPGPDRFSQVPWSAGPGGAPVLDGTVASLICRPEAFHDGGDHILIVGRVIQHSQRDAAALLFSQGRYRVAEEHPDLRSASRACAPERTECDVSAPLVRLLHRAHHFTSERFELLRRTEQLSVVQIRLLGMLVDGVQGGVDQLAGRACVRLQEAADAVQELQAMGYVVQQMSGQVALTSEGRDHHERFQRLIATVERKFLDGFTTAEVDAGRRFLSRLIAINSASQG
jgi:flavin reductase (DIM6/NTAB) family NADH-FMN oxidoreductase RutF/DNA-binding MarR family transcriptional regulator